MDAFVIILARQCLRVTLYVTAFDLSVKIVRVSDDSIKTVELNIRMQSCLRENHQLVYSLR